MAVKQLPVPGHYRGPDGARVHLRIIALWEGTVDLWVCVYQDQKTGAHRVIGAAEWPALFEVMP